MNDTTQSLVDTLIKSMNKEPAAIAAMNELSDAAAKCSKTLFDLARTLQDDQDHTTASLCAALVVRPSLTYAIEHGYAEYTRGSQGVSQE